MSKHRDIRIIRVPEGKEGERGPEKILGEVIAENFPNTRKKVTQRPGSTESHIQHKPKKENIETHNNHID